MKIFGIDISIVIITIITAYIGFLFNDRSKKRESFLKELSTSYEEVYSPMYEKLSEINDLEDSTRKLELIDLFFQKYSGDTNKVRYIASSFLLEYFYETKIIYLSYKKDNNSTNKKKLFDKLTGFFIMIEGEYWDAHDLIYKDHKQFQSDLFLNPFMFIIKTLFRLLYNLSSFLVIINLVALYFSIIDYFFHFPSFPEYLQISYVILFLMINIIIFSFLLMMKEFIVNKNRRSNRINKSIKKIFKKIFKFN